METISDLELLQDVNVEIEEPCEHSEHYDMDNPIHDDGPGVWYVKGFCDNCKRTFVMLTCDSFVKRGVHCDFFCECGNTRSFFEAYPSVVRKSNV